MAKKWAKRVCFTSYQTKTIEIEINTTCFGISTKRNNTPMVNLNWSIQIIKGILSITFPHYNINLTKFIGFKVQTPLYTWIGETAFRPSSVSKKRRKLWWSNDLYLNGFWSSTSSSGTCIIPVLNEKTPVEYLTSFVFRMTRCLADCILPLLHPCIVQQNMFLLCNTYTIYLRKQDVETFEFFENIWNVWRLFHNYYSLL